MKSLNVAMLGAGLMCKAHSEAYAVMPLAFGAEAVRPVRKVLCDVTMDLAKAAAERFGWEEYSDDWREVIARPDIDMVDIVAPNYLHRDMCIEAARHGKMIYCEKPLGLNAEESLEIYREIKRCNVANAMAFNKRRWPAVVYAKQLIDGGLIGEPVAIHGAFMQSFALNKSLPLTWKFQKEKTGGGAIIDIGCHLIDLTRFLMGDFDEVCGMLRTNIKQRPLPAAGRSLWGATVDENSPMGEVEVDDTAVFLGKFKNGAVGNFEVSRMASGMGDGMSFEIWGTEGAIRWNQQASNELQISKESDPADQHGFKVIECGGKHPYGSALWNVPFGVGFVDVKSLELHDVLEAFANGEEFHANFLDGLKCAQTVEAIIASSKDNQWVKVSSETE